MSGLCMCEAYDADTCGTVQSWWRGCRCSACVDARNEYQRIGRAA